MSYIDAQQELAAALQGQINPSTGWWIDRRNPGVVHAELRGHPGGGLTIDHFPQRDVKPWRLGSITGDTPVTWHDTALEAKKTADGIALA